MASVPFVSDADDEHDHVELACIAMKVDPNAIPRGDAYVGDEGNLYPNALEEDEGVQLRPMRDWLHGVDTDGSNRSGLASAVFNMVNTIIGGGLLALPYALAATGMALGLALTAAFALVNVVSARLIVALCVEPHCKGSSYAELCGRAIPYGKTVYNVILVTYGLGVLTAYNVVIKDTLSPYANSLVGGIDERLVLLLVVVVVLYPLVNLRRLDSLKFVSVGALAAILFLLGLVTVKCLGAEQRAPVSWINVDAGMWTALPLLSFAYTFHVNITPVWSEMAVPSAANFRKVMNISVLIAGSIYALMGFTGYLLYGSDVESNVLGNLSKSETVADVAKLFYVVIICLSYPLFAYSLRFAVLDLYARLRQRSDASARPDANSRSVIALVSGLIVLVSYAVGISVPSLALVLGIVGATAGALITFYLPALFHLRLTPSPAESECAGMPFVRYFLPLRRKAVALLCLAVGIITTVAGLVATIRDEVNADHASNSTMSS